MPSYMIPHHKEFMERYAHTEKVGFLFPCLASMCIWNAEVINLELSMLTVLAGTCKGTPQIMTPATIALMTTLGVLPAKAWVKLGDNWVPNCGYLYPAWSTYQHN